MSQCSKLLLKTTQNLKIISIIGGSLTKITSQHDAWRD